MLLLAPILLSLGSAPTVAGQAGSPPNVVLILLDDLDVRSVESMPNVRSLLAAEGTSFDHAFVTDPLCCPSRVSTLRGQYVHNHGVRLIPEAFKDFHRSGEESTVATWLDDAGYRTALIGKYLVHYPDGAEPTFVPPGWDRWVASSRRNYGYFNYALNVDGEIVPFGREPEAYKTDVEARYAQTFLEDAAAAADPFFLYLSPEAPHGPVVPAPRHAKAEVESQAPRTAAYDEPDVSDKPQWVQDWPSIDEDRASELDRWHQQRLRTLMAADDLVGTLVDTLAATGALDNTYVIFTSDQGYLLGEHRIEGKGVPYEPAIRVPLIMRGPGVAAGATDDRLVTNADLAPTIAALAGVEPPAFVDGRSLLPLLTGPEPTEWRDGVLIEYFFHPEGDEPIQLKDRTHDAFRAAYKQSPAWRAVRTQDRIYVAYESGERELYDLAADPLQLDNLLGPGRQPPPDTDTLAALLAGLETCAADACRVADRLPTDGTG